MSNEKLNQDTAEKKEKLAAPENKKTEPKIVKNKSTVVKSNNIVLEKPKNFTLVRDIKKV